MEPELVTELFHMLKSKYYIASVRSGAIKAFAVEPSSALLQSQNICRTAKVEIHPLGIAPPEDAAGHPAAKTLIERAGKAPAERLFQYVFKPAYVCCGASIRTPRLQSLFLLCNLNSVPSSFMKEKLKIRSIKLFCTNGAGKSALIRAAIFERTKADVVENDAEPKSVLITESDEAVQR